MADAVTVLWPESKARDRRGLEAALGPALTLGTTLARCPTCQPARPPTVISAAVWSMFWRTHSNYLHGLAATRGPHMKTKMRSFRHEMACECLLGRPDTTVEMQEKRAHIQAEGRDRTLINLCLGLRQHSWFRVPRCVTGCDGGTKR